MNVDPFRLRVMKAVTDQIKTITVANGYKHDLNDYADAAGRVSQRVFRGRDLFGASDPLPMISVLEDFRPQEQTDGGRDSRSSVQTGEWKLLIQGFVEDDAENPLDRAYHLGADVIVALVKAKTAPEFKNNILGLGGSLPCVSGLKIGQLIARPKDGDVSDVAFFFLTITLTLIEDLENPFA